MVAIKIVNEPFQVNSMGSCTFNRLLGLSTVIEFLKNSMSLPVSFFEKCLKSGATWSKPKFWDHAHAPLPHPRRNATAVERCITPIFGMEKQSHVAGLNCGQLASRACLHGRTVTELEL